MYKIFKHPNFHVSHVWGKRILSCNDTTFFCGIAGFFEVLRVACFWVCFNCNLLVFWACFLQISVFLIAFFFKFYGNFLFQFAPKGILGVFL